jgi:hypothetical protein
MAHRQDAKSAKEEEINKFTHRFLGVLRVFAVKIGVELNHCMQETETFWNDADGSETILQVQAASPLCGDERVSGICGADGAARSLFDPDRPNSCAKKIKS